MNRKKIFATLGLTVLIAVIFTSAKAQQLINYSNNIFTITAPAIDPQVFKGKTPYTKAFLETGSGAFFILPASNNTPPPFSQTWYYKQNGAPQPVVQLATFYDTIRRPPHGSSLIINAMNTQGQNSVQNLVSTSYITVTNAVNDGILPLDTMTIAITYKNTPLPAENIGVYTNSVIAFFYNNTDNPTLFRPVPTDNTTYHYYGADVKPIRMHNGETLTTYDALPNAIKNLMRINGRGYYANEVYITAPYIPDGKEKNIFLSLASSSLENIQTQNVGSYKAVLIDYNNSGGAIVKVFDRLLVTNLTSHDPNHIITTPCCLDGYSAFAGVKIDYDIQFVNDGRAAATLIKDTVTIPRGIQFPSSGENLFTCTIGGDKLIVLREGGTVLVQGKNPRYCSYRLDPDAGKIYFTIHNARLSNNPGLFARNNVGNIKFSLKTNPDGSGIQQCMYSRVSIKFDDNPPIHKNCLIRIHCKSGIQCADVDFNDPKKGQ
ncbi:MAG: hypothetical protein ABI666_08660 [Ferruginibacter sp.]